MNNKKKSLYIGINPYDHDTGIFVVSDVEKDIFAISTDRITRYKHDDLFPIPALNKYLKYKKIDVDNIDTVSVSVPYLYCKSKTISKNLYQYNIFLRNFLNALYIGAYLDKLNNLKKERYSPKFFAKKGSLSLVYFWILSKIGYTELDNIIAQYFQDTFKNAKINITYFDHEYCHATTAYYMSPYDKALVFTMDGYGDSNVYSRIYLGNQGKLTEIGKSSSSKPFFDLGHNLFSKIAMCSIGGIYTYFTRLIGFGESDEGKTEALAAYGCHDKLLFENLISIVAVINGDIVIDEKKAENILNYYRMKDVLDRIGKENIAATVQKFTEEIIEKQVQYYVNKYKIQNICLSGGVYANVVINLRIFERISKDIYIAPAMTDEGAAQGALLADMVVKNIDIGWLRKSIMPYYGVSYSQEEVLEEVRCYKGRINYKDISKDWHKEVAKFISDGKIGAIFNGRMEYGPRSLGNRSIVASPTIHTIRSKMNIRIKKRPEFQPFCPSMLDEEKDRLFDNAYLNKHMSIAFRMKREFHEDLPSAIHIDGTARVQFVSKEDNQSYYALLLEVKKLTGFGVILNTSFNMHGRTVVETPKDAITDFLDTDLDFLLIEGLLVTKI